MKYALSLIVGFIVGMLLVAAVIFYNPLTRENPAPQLSATAGSAVEVFYRAGDTLLRTGHVGHVLASVPPAVPELDSPALDGAAARVVVLRDVDGSTAGLGLRLDSLSRETRLLTGDLLRESVWNLRVAGEGSAFIAGVDNLWPVVREVLVPAWRADDKTWSGTFASELTVGPGSDGLAELIGGSGRFAPGTGDAREAVTVRQLSLEHGFIEADGSVLLSLSGDE